MTAGNVQAPRAVVMIRPHHFRPNPETLADNVFQITAPTAEPAATAAAALAEFDAAVETLRAAGVVVHVFDDPGVQAPDAVFPNNWFSTHHGGRIAVYPMTNPSRRMERRGDVLELLKREYRVQEMIDYSGLEFDGLFLEGTGAMVLDHLERVAYVGRSNRADPIILERFCTAFGYEPMAFDTADPHGIPVYHTNVMMSVGTEFALVCSEVITDPARRSDVVGRLAETGRSVVDISWEQVTCFAGNVLEVSGDDHRYLAISARALSVLTSEQIATIEQSCELLPISIPTIELAGGSVRCMLASVHLTPRRVLDVAVASGKAPSRAALVGSAVARETRLGPLQREPAMLREAGPQDDLDELVDWADAEADQVEG